MRWWLCVAAALAAACDSSSSNLRVVAITTEGLAPGDDARAAAVYCRYTNGQLDKDAPAEVGGRSICPPDPDDFRAAKLAPKGVRLRVVFNKPLDAGAIARRGVLSFDGDGPVRVTCMAATGSIEVTTTFSYLPDDPFGPTLLIVPDLVGHRVPTSAACTLAIDRAVVDAGGTPVEPGSVYPALVADLGLVKIEPVNDSDTVLSPVGAIAFTFNADLDRTSLEDDDFRVAIGTTEVPIDFDIPTAADNIVHVFPSTPYPPGSYTASVRSNADIQELNGGGFVFDPAGTNTFAFTVNDTVVTGFEISTPDNSVPLGVPVPFTATATLSDGNTVDVTSMATWSVDNTLIATISNAAGTRGQLTSVDEGAVTVTGMMGTFSDTFNLTIEDAALVSIDVSPATATIADGSTQQFTALGTFTAGSPVDITTQVTWSTSNASIATISPTGLATTVGNTMTGPVTITATMGAISDTASLTVSAATLQSITVSCDDDELPLGLTLDCQAMGMFSDGSTLDITGTATWTATPAARVSVNASGVASTPAGSTVGPATITATVGAISDDLAITVTDAVLQSIAIDGPDGWDLPIGTDLPFFATGTYSNGAMLDVTNIATWTAAPAGRISIGATGVATAPNTATTGAATVTATIGTLSDISTGAVSPAVLETIVVTPDNLSRPVGTTQQFQAMGTFSDGSQLDITSLASWTTSNGSFATVSSTGLVTMVAPGAVSVFATRGTVTDSASLTVTPSAPEIAVDNGPSIPDPGADQVGVELAGIPFTRSYRVQNTGTANLTLGAVTFPAGTNCTASLDSAPGMTTVAPGGSTMFSVSVTPTNPGVFSCPVALANNDADEGPYNIDIRGVAVRDTGAFANMDGIFDGDNGCGMGSFTLRSDTGIVLSNLTGNAPLLFLLTAAATASASGVVVFAIGNHTCTITRVGTTFVISMSCSNTSGGSCSESFSRRAAPEIAVEDISTGDEQFSGTSESYALLPTGVRAVDWEYRIRNDGNAPLNLGTITFTNDINCNATIVGAAPAATLAPGASTTVTFRATPVANGPYLCTVQIPSNDSDENPFVLRLLGEAF